MADILLFCWNDLNDGILQRNLEELGHRVHPFARKFKNYDMDGEFAMAMMTELHKYHCTYCFSFNYLPLISGICDVVGIPYISWVFDSPNLTLYSKTIYYPVNYVFTFDKLIYEDLRARGVQHCYHLPLAVDGRIFSEKSNSFRAIKSEVSFVGSLYTDQYNYFDSITDWDPETYKVCNRLIEEQKFNYRDNVIRRELTEKNIQQIIEIAGLRLGDKYDESPLDMAAMMLQKKVTVEERRELLQAISEQHELDLYTGSDTDSLPQAHNRGKVDYLTQMPKVFRNSRINLNITLRSIESGIPLRALDIMGCGGFLLSNYQPELAAYFEDGKEMVLFYDKQDCLDKIAYYLAHEEERNRVALAGREKVRNEFSYQKALQRIFSIVEG